MTKKTVVTSCLTLVLLLLGTSCASVVKRRSALRDADNSPFIGVRADLEEMESNIHPSLFQNEMPLFGGPFFPVYITGFAIVLADFPLSLAVDTLLYPTDKIYGVGRLIGEKPHHVSLTVLDENDRPISSATVYASCYRESSGLTDKNGIFSITNFFSGVLSCDVKCRGYYDSSGSLWIPLGDSLFPTNGLVIHLRRKLDPVPMICRRVSSAIPRVDEKIGFDLQVGDWVEPDGKGKVTDMILFAKTRYGRFDDYDVEASLSFPNPLDGVFKYAVHVCLDPGMSNIVNRTSIEPPWYRRTIENWMTSSYRPPHLAPTVGYVDSLSLYCHRDKRKKMFTSSWQGMMGWVFRVRTETNELGKVSSSHVGWTDSDFCVDITRTGAAQISFTYYYNLDPISRSLEPAETTKD